MRNLLYIIFTIFLLTACSSEEEEYNPVRGMWETPHIEGLESFYEVYTKDFKYAPCDIYGIPKMEYYTYTIDSKYIYFNNNTITKYKIVNNPPEFIEKGVYLYTYNLDGTLSGIVKKRE